MKKIPEVNVCKLYLDNKEQVLEALDKEFDLEKYSEIRRNIVKYFVDYIISGRTCLVECREDLGLELTPERIHQIHNVCMRKLSTSTDTIILEWHRKWTNLDAIVSMSKSYYEAYLIRLLLMYDNLTNEEIEEILSTLTGNMQVEQMLVEYIVLEKPSAGQIMPKFRELKELYNL